MQVMVSSTVSPSLDHRPPALESGVRDSVGRNVLLGICSQEPGWRLRLKPSYMCVLWLGRPAAVLCLRGEGGEQGGGAGASGPALSDPQGLMEEVQTQH